MGCTGSSQEQAADKTNSGGSTGSTGKSDGGSSVVVAAKKKNPAEYLPYTMDARYKLGEVLGEGGFAVVKLGISNIDKHKVAVKIISRASLKESDDEHIRQEVAILKSLNHKNITRLLDFFVEESSFYMVLEYLDGGELFDRIVKKQVYTEKEARDTVLILLTALKYCHDKHIVHRDLKPENLLLTSKSNETDVKIADFGFAEYAKDFTITSQCGTPGYIAPEILRKIPYGKPCDMWSFGVILYILLGGYPPFHDDNQRALFKKICRGEYKFHRNYWGGVSKDAKNLIRGLLTVDHNKRLTVDQALAHPWLKLSEATLSSYNLDANLAELRKYLALRKLRAGVRAVIAMNRMKYLAGSLKAEDAEDAAAAASAADVEGEMQDDPDEAAAATGTVTNTATGGLGTASYEDSTKASVRNYHPATAAAHNRI